MPQSTWMKAFILAVRQIRGEMDIAPSRKIPLLLQNAGDRDSAHDRLASSYLIAARRARIHELLEPGRSRAGIRHAPFSATSHCWCRWPA